MLFSTGILLLTACASLSAGSTAPAYPGNTFYKGFDLSSLKIEEDGGAIYKDTLQGNATLPVELILKGMNTVRLRLWIHPTVPFDDGCE